MNKFIFVAMALFSVSLFAQEVENVELFDPDDSLSGDAQDEFVPKEEDKSAVSEKPSSTAYVPEEQKIETEVEEKKEFKAKASHWYATYGFEGMEYELPFKYDGEKEDFNTEKRKLYGGRIGFGREFYLGAGFMTSTRVEGFYMGTLFEKAKTADPEIKNETIASTKSTGQIYGADAVQTLSFLWEGIIKNPIMDTYSHLTFEPFVEAGIGRASAFNKKDYFYHTIVNEEYDQAFKDELTNVKFGIGLNINAKDGFFCYFKATQNNFDLTKRSTKGYYYRNNQTRTPISEDQSDNELDSIMVYSIGGGYKF